MVRLEIISDVDGAVGIIKKAIQSEIKRLEISLNKTNRMIKEFEDRYKIPSKSFLSDYAAEDLEGGDEEYITWTGELHIRERLSNELNQLKEIIYVAK